jgi:hypothetical protein
MPSGRIDSFAPKERYGDHEEGAREEKRECKIVVTQAN